MKVHERPCVLLDLPGVDENLGEAQAVADVGRAAPPLPALVFTVEALLLFVAAAVAQVALGTGGRDGVGHACCDDGVGERGLFASWEWREKDEWMSEIYQSLSFLQYSIFFVQVKKKRC